MIGCSEDLEEFGGVVEAWGNVAVDLEDGRGSLETGAARAGICGRHWCGGDEHPCPPYTGSMSKRLLLDHPQYLPFLDNGRLVSWRPLLSRSKRFGLHTF